jgi:hypothetical protein
VLIEPPGERTEVLRAPAARPSPAATDDGELLTVAHAPITEALVTQAISPTAVPAQAAPPISGPGIYRAGDVPASLPPQMRPGTVYGGQTGLPTSANPEAPIDASGSLTGLILSRGESGQLRPTEQRSRLAKVLIVGVSALAFVTVIALVVAVLAGDIIAALFEGLLK